MFVTLLKLLDVTYSSPVNSYQLLQSNYRLSEDLLPTPIRMNLTLVKKLLQHDDPCQLLEYVQHNGHKTLIMVYHDTEGIHHVLERVKKDEKHLVGKLFLDGQQQECLILCFTQL